MEDKPGFTRRNALKAIGGLGLSLLLPSSAYSKSPSELCSAHFRGLPDWMRGPNGEVYTRQRSGLYRSESGRIMAVDGHDMILSGHFRDKEDMWENALQTGRYNGRLLFFEDPDIDSLKTCLEDEKWNALTDGYQQKTINSWENKDKMFRRFVCDIYLNIFDNFYNKYLNDDQKSDFRRFVKSYRFAIDNFDTPENKMFKTRDGSVHRTYTNGYPWLCLSFPDVSDRALIFSQEVFHENNGKRIDWDYVRDRGR